MCFQKVSVINSENCYFAALASPSCWSQGMSFFVLFCLFPSWGGTRWNGTKKQRWHFTDGNLLPTLCCGFANRILGIAVLNPLMKWYSCDIQNVNFRNFL